MTLKKRVQSPQREAFLVYDGEWVPADKENTKQPYRLRMMGVYDTHKGYRYYVNIKAFLEGELTPENANKIFFAHSGGKSDFQFVLEGLVSSHLAKERFLVEAAFNGSSAFLVTISDRRDPKTRWTFADSLFLLRTSLANIGKWIGMEKGEVAFDTPDFGLLRDYNEQDCRILYQAITDLETELREMGGGLRVTLASSAMFLFQAHYLEDVEVQTSHSLNNWMRQTYFASRVEVLTTECKNGNYFDINSSFPWSMCQPIPGRCTDTSYGRLPRSGLYAAEVEIEIDKRTYIPPTPFRDKLGRILFPTGRWNTYLTKPDIDLLLEQGHTIHKVGEVVHFAPFSALGDYVRDLYDKKAKAEGFKREVYKLLLNSLYGKFAEREEKEKLLIDPQSVECPHNGLHEMDDCMRCLAPGFWVRKDFVHLPHVHVPISAFVTAYSRRLLYESLVSCERVYYTDTDSIVCSERDVFPVSDVLGALKLEHEIESGTFVSPKLYMLRDRGEGREKRQKKESQKGEPRDVIVKSKGFSKLDGVSFDKLIKGESVVLERMAGIKENLRKRDLRPGEIRVEKRVRGEYRKRRHLRGSIETEPWTIEEVKNMQTSSKSELLDVSSVSEDMKGEMEA